MHSIFRVLLLATYAAAISKFDLNIKLDGEGLHRTLSLTVPEQILNSSAILKWDITPDFYVDVYELERRHFQFRIDNGDSLFIDIEVPADRARFHTLSLNLHQTAITVPFHLRYQPPSFDHRTTAEILIPSPGIEFLRTDGKVRFVSGDPFFVSIPVGNAHDKAVVTFSTIATTMFGSFIFLRALYKK